jgi:hypothetical protein
MVKRSLPAMEFCADLVIVLRRELPPEEWKAVELYHLKRVNYRRCALLLGWPVAAFYGKLYTIEGHAGSALADAGLYPIKKYFNREQRRGSVHLQQEMELRDAA